MTISTLLINESEWLSTIATVSTKVSLVSPLLVDVDQEHHHNHQEQEQQPHNDGSSNYYYQKYSSSYNNQNYRRPHHLFPQYSNPHLTYHPCDRIYISRTLNATHGRMNGSFTGPNLSHYPPMDHLVSNETIGEVLSTTTIGPDSSSAAAATNITTTTVEPYSRQCVYTFIAAPNERVRVSFTKFSLRSEAPDCFTEYVDIYAETPSIETDLLNTPFGGRYCDKMIPHDRISMYHIISLGYYTEKRFSIGEQLFIGNYEFFPNVSYISGTRLSQSECSYAMYSDQKREGQFKTPTYPGVYPKNLTCNYVFKGTKGQRVRIEFMDFDLYYGGAHCPFDYIQIYDGDSMQNSPLIDTYCGQHRQLVVYSSGTSLFVHFHTLSRMADVQNRGFIADYEFSEKFVNLGFIRNNENSVHILGTECDQKILSRKESNGTIYAPNYPFLYHPNIQCKYYIYGLQDAQHLEKVNFQFETLQIPTKDANECTDAYVRLYSHTLNNDEFDYIFCGDQIPGPVVSDGPIMMVVFNSGSTQGQGFKARYWFETDYKIPGTQATPGECKFTYYSSLEADNNEQFGEFNSPHYPSNYPSNTICQYDFIAQPNERIMLVFSHFKYSDSDVIDVPGYDDICTHDWLEIYSLDDKDDESINTLPSNEKNNSVFYGRYCTSTTPGPILTEPGINRMRIISRTDESDVSSGFYSNYWFVKNVQNDPVCGGNITNEISGTIETPNFPNNYPSNRRQFCDWIITTENVHNRIMLYFETFAVEGDPLSRGCSGAAVRVWTDPGRSKPIELCGENLSKVSKQFLSKSNQMRITFLTAQKSVGATGFRAIWTEVMIPVSGDANIEIVNYQQSQIDDTIAIIPKPINIEYTTTRTPTSSKNSSINSLKLHRGKCRKRNQSERKEMDLKILPNQPFHCLINDFCISPSLRCNGVANCGFSDQSDEYDCQVVRSVHFIELFGGLAGLTMLIVFTFGLLCLFAIIINVVNGRRKRRQRREAIENNNSKANNNNNNVKQFNDESLNNQIQLEIIPERISMDLNDADYNDDDEDLMIDDIDGIELERIDDGNGNHRYHLHHYDRRPMKQSIGYQITAPYQQMSPSISSSPMHHHVGTLPMIIRAANRSSIIANNCSSSSSSSPFRFASSSISAHGNNEQLVTNPATTTTTTTTTTTSTTNTNTTIHHQPNERQIIEIHPNGTSLKWTSSNSMTSSLNGQYDRSYCGSISNVSIIPPPPPPPVIAFATSNGNPTLGTLYSNVGSHYPFLSGQQQQRTISTDDDRSFVEYQSQHQQPRYISTMSMAPPIGTYQYRTFVPIDKASNGIGGNGQTMTILEQRPQHSTFGYNYQPASFHTLPHRLVAGKIHQQQQQQQQLQFHPYNRTEMNNSYELQSMSQPQQQLQTQQQQQTKNEKSISANSTPIKVSVQHQASSSSTNTTNRDIIESLDSSIGNDDLGHEMKTIQVNDGQTSSFVNVTMISTDGIGGCGGNSLSEELEENVRFRL